MGKVFDVKEPRVVKPIANGAYTGVIVGIKYRDAPYQYADVMIQVDNMVDTVVSASFPAKDLTPSNAFGKFLTNWKKFAIGEKIDPEAILMGQRVSFMIMNLPSKNDPSQLYPQVVKGSVFAQNPIAK